MIIASKRGIIFLSQLDYYNFFQVIPPFCIFDFMHHGGMIFHIKTLHVDSKKIFKIKVDIYQKYTTHQI